MGFWAECRKEDDFFNRVDAGEQHRKSVDANAQATGWRHAVLEGTDVVLVDTAGLGIASFPGSLFVFEAGTLLDGIVEFGVAIAEFATIDEDLESFGQERVVAIDPGQW